VSTLRGQDSIAVYQTVAEVVREVKEVVLNSYL
jgi:hypothetical protein